ncbi:hypothetical protein [Kitasatospora sp. NPDC088346]|uniref:hypothetical protein n=1 Tax=Kitasatospora sp. NPDC088346 TaxID=3364073 RepID=UPI0038014B1B
MANIPKDLKYSKDHEWVRPSANGQVQIGKLADPKELDDLLTAAEYADYVGQESE